MKNVSLDLFSYICYNFANFCIPDGGWDTQDENDVNFECEELPEGSVVTAQGLNYTSTT